MILSPQVPSRIKDDRFVLIATIAVASHLFFFRLVELWPEQLAKLYSLLFVLDASIRHHYASSSITTSCIASFVDLTAYTVFLLASIGVYRLFFHRISSIPGPKSWALSKWATAAIDKQGVRPRAVHAVHLKYGDVVRTGPREVSINSPLAVAAITSPKSGSWKGPWYEGVGGGREPYIQRSIFAMMDRAEHHRQRKAWDMAFNAKALKGYEPMLINNMEIMLRELGKRANAGEAVDLDEYGVCFAFDTIAEVGFGRNMGLLEQGKLSPIIEQLEQALKFQQMLSNRPYMVEVTRRLRNPIQGFMNMVLEMLEDREKLEARPDIMRHLTEARAALQAEDNKLGHKQAGVRDDKMIKGTNTGISADARLVVVAGSDTSSTVMAMTMFLLLQHPEAVNKLRQELDTVFGLDYENVLSDFSQLDKACPYLNGIINESMRLYPPVATGLQKVNSQGPTVIELHSGEKIIVPKDVVITVPTLTMQRDPRNFSPLPDAFRPERWVHPEKEERFERKAFIPFSAGTTVCVGRQLAYQELRVVVANLVRRFDMVPTDDFDAKAFEDGVRDNFVSYRLKKLSVKLRVRNGTEAWS